MAMFELPEGKRGVGFCSMDFSTENHSKPRKCANDSSTSFELIVWLGVWNMFLFPYIGIVFIIPTDFHIFQRDSSTTKQFVDYQKISHIWVWDICHKAFFPFLCLRDEARFSGRGKRGKRGNPPSNWATWTLPWGLKDYFPLETTYFQGLIFSWGIKQWPKIGMACIYLI